MPCLAKPKGNIIMQHLCLLWEADCCGFSSVVLCRSQADIDLKAGFVTALIGDFGHIT